MFDRKLLAIEGIRPMLAFCVACSLASSALIVCQACSLAQAIVSIWEGAIFMSEVPCVCAFAVCFVARSGLRAFHESRMEMFAHAWTMKLRGKFLGRLFDCSGAMPQEFGSAHVVTQAISGCESIERYVATVLPKTVSLFIVPLCLAIFVFTQDAISGIIVIVCYPFIIAFMRLIGYSASDESAKRHEGFEEMSNHFLDSLRGMETLRAFGISRPYSKSVFAASERYRKLIMKTLRIAQLSGAVLDVFATCGLAAVAIMLGFRMVEGSVMFLPALTVLMLVPEYFMPIKAYAADYHASLEGSSALARMLEMLECKKQRVELPDGGIVVETGKKVAIAGESGAGKSTVLDAISGIADIAHGGAVVAGTNSAGFQEEGWQRRVAYIPQSPAILRGTLRENVSLYRKDATDEQITRALDAVGLGDVLSELPGGLDAEIGDGFSHVGFSGGQSHRIALARALVDPERDIWLLDEPGASIDVQTELELKDDMLPLMEGKTVVIATHKRHWLDDVDAVLNVDTADGVRHV